MSRPALSVVSDDHLRAIGAVIVNWTAVEIVMELTILGLYEIPTDRGLVITSNLTVQNKLAMLRILATKGAIKDTATIEKMLDILKRIEAGAADRNRVAHSMWQPGKVQGLAQRLEIRVRGRRLDTPNEQVPLSEVEGIALSLLDLRSELAELAAALGFRPELSART
ncbi:MAG: hypothetical protein V4477_17010 [Pseudomonadota bacterium]